MSVVGWLPAVRFIPTKDIPGTRPGSRLVECAPAAQFVAKFQPVRRPRGGVGA
jgi:hypothetical protein